MKLDKTLNFKKVRCVKGYDGCLKVGKEYNVIDIGVEIKVKDDRGELLYWESDHFEQVPNQAENPLQNMKLTPEFEVVEPVLADNSADIKDTPKFKVGDPVYFPRLSNKLCVIGEGQEDDYVDEVNGLKALAKMQSGLDFVYDQKTKSWVWNKIYAACPLIHVTPENHALLSQLQPHIEFEQPPKELMGSDLARDLIKKGWKGFTCVCGNSGDDNVMITTIVTGTNNSGQFVDFKGRLFNNAIPMLGSYPLTQAVLDE